MESAPSTAAVMERKRLTAELDLAEAAAEPSSFVVKIRRQLPNFARSINLKFVRLGLRSGGIPAPSSWVPLPLVPPLLAAAAYSLVGADKLYSLDVLTCVTWLAAAVLLLTVYFLKRPWPVYLLDFACYRPGDEHAVGTQ